MTPIALGIGIAVVGVVCFGWGWLSRHEAQCAWDAAERGRAELTREMTAQERAEWKAWEARQRQFEEESG